MVKLQPGTYRGELIEATFGPHPNTQTPMVQLEFQIVAVANGEQWRELSQQTKRTVQLFLTQKAKDWTFAKLGKLRWNGNLQNPEFPAELYNEGTPVVCTHEQRDGKAYEKWDVYYQSGNAGLAKPDQFNPSEAAQISAEYKAFMKAQQAKRAGGAAPPQPQPTPQTQAVDGDIPPEPPADDDLPF